MSQLDTFTNMLTGLSRGTFDELILYRGGSYQDLNTIFNGLGGGSGAITALVGAGAAVVSGTGSSRTITVDLSSHATTAAVNALLANYVLTSAYNTAMATKLDGLTAGSGIQITGSGTARAIACTASPLTLQLDGATQAGATTLNFVGNNASLSAGVLNISRMAWQDKVVLRYSNAASDKDLTQGNSGELLWNGSQVALTSQTFQQINTVAPLSASGANIITLETLWKPSTVSVGVGLQTTVNDANGTLTLTLDGTESRSALKLIDTQSVVRPLAASIRARSSGMAPSSWMSTV